MSCLSAVETGPNIAVVVGDLACIALWGFHGVLAPELCVRGLWACHLRLSPILHWGLRSWCSVAEAFLLQCAELIRLALHGGRGDMIAAELLHKFLSSDVEASLVATQ